MSLFKNNLISRLDFDLEMAAFYTFSSSPSCEMERTDDTGPAALRPSGLFH